MFARSRLPPAVAIEAGVAHHVVEVRLDKHVSLRQSRRGRREHWARPPSIVPRLLGRPGNAPAHQQHADQHSSVRWHQPLICIVVSSRVIRTTHMQLIGLTAIPRIVSLEVGALRKASRLRQFLSIYSCRRARWLDCCGCPRSAAAVRRAQTDANHRFEISQPLLN